MIEISIGSVFAFFVIWFFILRTYLRKRGISSSGADFFQVFVKDILLSVSLAKKGDYIIAFVLVIMVLCVILTVLSIGLNNQ
jgi:hypothetical protein